MMSNIPQISLWKGHGLGNDYLVWEGPDNFLTPSRVSTLCHRHLGVGGDGILEPCFSEHVEYGVRIWNPDGSVAEKSGNGLRIFARWLRKKHAASLEFSIDTGASMVRARVDADEQISIDMGRPTFEPSTIPTTELLWGAPFEQGEIYTVGIGNPHCVVLFSAEVELDELPWRCWGAELECDERFPNRINVQFVEVLSRRAFRMRIWERGAGETQASGSSSCAVFAVLHRLGMIEACATAEMPGGELELSQAEDDSILLKGPVKEVGQISLSKSFIADLLKL
jgi:diaminopimelate epimerase